uniref:Integrase catalytic domain-containing protein n=1 Tax=Strongyloides venezuelensis TaxID=75913 RepID=A0A0K0FJP4_STRVS
KFKDTFHWPAIDNDIRRVWSSCQQCIQNKPHGPLQATVNAKSLPIPPHPWHTLSLDHLVVNENSYILVLIDEFSKFVKLHHVSNMGALTTTRELTNTFFLLGFPHTLKTDNGPAFIADTFKSFCKTFNISHYLVSAYNHQGNAIVERFNRAIRESIRIYNEIDILELINSIQYVHNFSYMTNHEGKPKEYILSTIDRYTNENYINIELSGRRSLLEYIKTTLHNSNDKIPSNTFTIIPNDTIVFKKNVSAHKNDTQFLGPYKIVEHLHGDTYMIIKLTKSHRPTGLPERVNARILKLAPKVIQEQSQKLANEDSSITVPTDTSISIQPPINSTDNLPKRGRGRPKKITTTFNIKENNVSDKPLPKRGRGRPRKNNN